MGRDWVGRWLGLLAVAVLNLPMHLVPFYVDSAEWTCRTKVFACTTADTDLRVHYWYAENLAFPYRLALCIYPFAFLVHLERLIERHHLDSASWTLACTVTASLAVSKWYAVLLHPNGMTYLNGSFLLNGYRKDRTCRTDI